MGMNGNGRQKSNSVRCYLCINSTHLENLFIFCERLNKIRSLDDYIECEFYKEREDYTNGE